MFWDHPCTTTKSISSLHFPTNIEMTSHIRTNTHDFPETGIMPAHAHPSHRLSSPSTHQLTSFPSSRMRFPLPENSRGRLLLLMTSRMKRKCAKAFSFPVYWIRDVIICTGFSIWCVSAFRNEIWELFRNFLVVNWELWRREERHCKFDGGVVSET